MVFLGSFFNQIYVAPSLVCSYDRDKDSFLGFVPEQTCDAEFTPHSDPSFDQFQSYMLGNVDYNVGGVSCSDCPQGQYPITTYGYTCETGVQRNMYCADGLEGNCLFGFVGTSKLFDCKAQCNLIENCQILNFITDTNFEEIFFGTDVSKHSQTGVFDRAENGSIYLKEITDLPKIAQDKLLAVLSSNTFKRPGEKINTPLKTRLISGSRYDSASILQKNMIRADLFHRLNVIEVSVPPLSS